MAVFAKNQVFFFHRNGVVYAELFGTRQFPSDFVYEDQRILANPVRMNGSRGRVFKTNMFVNNVEVKTLAETLHKKVDQNVWLVDSCGSHENWLNS